MGIAAYNRGTRAISAYIDQQLAESRRVKVQYPTRIERENNRLAFLRQWRLSAIQARDWSDAFAADKAIQEQIAGMPDQIST